MKAPNQNPWPICFRQRSLKLELTLVYALAAATSLFAQSVVITPPIIPVIERPVVEPKSDTNELDGATGLASTASPSSLGGKNPFQWGPVILHPHVGYGYTYGTGIQSSPGQAQRTAINSASVGIGMDLGKVWQFNYTAGASFYSDTNFNNNVSHTFSLAGKTSYEDWTFSLSQDIAITSDPLIETGQQTDQQSLSTTFGASYQINSEYSIDLTAEQNFLDAQGYTNALGASRDWSTMGWLNYRSAPTLTTGVGIGGGYNMVANGPDMTYEDMQGRVSWQTFRKISLSLNIGAQVRQFLGTDQSSLITPTYGLSIIYQPLSTTSLYINGSRGVGDSYFQDSITVSSSLSVGVSQRLFRKLYLSINTGLSLTAYQSSVNGLTGRDDHYKFVNVGLSTTFLKHGTASVNYSVSQNTSKDSFGYNYNSDQFGISIGYGY